MNEQLTVYRNIPRELRARRQWLPWDYDERDGKLTKVPRGKVNNPRSWMPYELACGAVRSKSAHADGIGYVLSHADPFVGVDLDACMSDGVLAPDAQAIIDAFDSYWEISPSGNGVHIFVMGEWPVWARNRARGAWGGSLEVYDGVRFLTITGEGHGRIAACQPQLDELSTLLGRAEPTASGPFDWDQKPPLGVGFDGSDEQLLQRARAAGNSWQFEALYDRGELASYDDDASRADLALVGMLAFWTGPDPQRIDRLFRGSALYREKWEREDYSARTIQLALADRDESDYYSTEAS
jgi:putative DNA primase/helicase